MIHELIEYYSKFDPGISVEHYEFAVRRGNKFVRHLGFKSLDELRRYLSRPPIPEDVYRSTYICLSPSSQDMDEKMIKMTELFFEIDLEFDYLNDRILDDMKFELWKLVDCLRYEFGVSESDLKINFSGHRGFHVIVRDKDFINLDQDQRAEIVEYMTNPDCRYIKESFVVFRGRLSRISRLIGHSIEKFSVIKIDPKSSIDIHRLKRLEESIHPCGLKASVISIDEIDEFSPFIQEYSWIDGTCLFDSKIDDVIGGYRIHRGLNRLPIIIANYLSNRDLGEIKKIEK